MKTLTYLLIAIMLPAFALAQDDLDYPTDIVYDSESETYYVSNWADGEGYILKLDKDGNILETYFDELHYAGGMCIVENTLFVLDNLDLSISGGNLLPSYLIGIDLTTGNEISKVEIAPDNTYLNFVERANDNLYISDSQKSIIHKYNIQDKTVENFLTDLNSVPFGICYDEDNERLLYTEYGYKYSKLKSVNLSGDEISTVYYTYTYIKAVISHPTADYYYSCWDTASIQWAQWGDEEVRKVKYDFTWDFLSSNDHNRPFGLCIGYNDVIAVCNWGDHTLSFIEDEVFSVEEQSSKTNLYTVYPNPSNGKFNIRFYDIASNNLEISILNIAGQQVFQEKLNNSDMLAEKKFNLQHLPAGTYVVILKDDRSISQKKLIIN